ncbi:MAG: DUF1015 domain-containing protein, partial [Sedimentisphaerales bacterium]|nr:DUF1015 domain-containing protein [Sedimentisphaerales bacterium]
MMEVKPFKAFRYNPQVVGDAARCIAPPYDVIGDEEQERLHRRSRYNVAYITRGKSTPSDNGQHNVYTRAAEYLRNWISEGALKQDDENTIYGYVQDFELNGAAFQRLTFIALGKLEDFGKTVRPHEQVFEKPLLDRLNLERATNAKFGLVFMLYDDPQGVADRIIEKAMTGIRDQGSGVSRDSPNPDARHPTPALMDFVDEQGVRHRLFAITAAREIEAITTMMADKSCIIADGHHRYTTGLKHMRESDNPAAKYQMLAFTNTRQKGLVVLATHRLVGGIPDFRPQQFLLDLKDHGFTIMKFGSAPDEAAKEQARQQMLRTLTDLRSTHDRDLTVFGLYMGGGLFYVAVLEDESRMAAVAPERSEAWRSLDVSVLQKLVLEGLLGLDEQKMGDPDYVDYVKDVPNAVHDVIARVDAG